MSRLTIDTGTEGNPATGDSLRGAFTKVNTNFQELYAELGGDSLDTLIFTNNTISSGITNGTLVLEGNGTGAVDIEGIQVNDNQIITTTSNANLLLDGNGTGTVVINGLSFPIADGTAGQVLKTDGAGNLSFTAVDPGAITFVGDDSTGIAVSIGETFKIVGAGSVTTAVSGDTLTITGTSSSTGDFVFSGNTLSTTSSNADMELDPAGTGNLVLKSGNFLPATDNTQYLGSADKRWHTLYVGPGSININGVSITESEGKLSLGNSTSVSGTLEVNEITSADSTAIQINDAINVSGLLTANAGLTINNNSNTWSFGSDGNLTVPSGKGIQSANGGYQASITLNPYRVLSQTIEPDDNSYSVANNDFGSATWTDIGFGSSTITLTTPENYVLDFISTELSLVNNVTVRINGAGAEYPYSYSNGNEIILTGAPADGPIDVTAIRFSYQRISKIHIEPDDGVFDIISRAGTHIDIDAGNDLRMTAYDDVLITAGGQIRLRSGDDYVEITTNYDVPNATSQVWRFGTDGVLTFPDSTTQSTAATITVVGDDSTGTTLNAGETIRIAGTQNITTAVSGDTLTITGPNLSSYLTSVPSTIAVNEISSSDSSAIQINDAVNISGALTFHGAGLTFPDATTQTTAFTGNAATINITNTNGIDTNYSITFVENRDADQYLRGDVDLTFNSATNLLTAGNIATNTIVVNELSSADSSAIQINDAVNVSGSIAASSIVANNLLTGIKTSTIVSGVLTLDFTFGTHIVNHNANITSITFTNASAVKSSQVTVILTQDATGGRTITGSYATAGGLGLDISTTANAVNIITFLTRDNSTFFGFSNGKSFS